MDLDLIMLIPRNQNSSSFDIEAFVVSKNCCDMQQVSIYIDNWDRIVLLNSADLTFKVSSGVDLLLKADSILSNSEMAESLEILAKLPH